MRYLATRMRRDATLWPQGAAARANIDRWMDRSRRSSQVPQGVVFWGLVRTPPEKRDLAAIARATEGAARAWGLLESSLTRFPYIAGNAFTLADIVWGPHVHRWFVMPVERPDMPYLRAWYERLLQRPAYVAHCAGPLS